MILALALASAGVLAAIVPGATPALANHDNDNGHWNQPPLVVSQMPTFLDGIVQDAAYYWQDVAFFRGYYPPLPYHGAADCSAMTGVINVCMVQAGDFHLDGSDGATRPFLYPDGSGHIQAAVIYLSNQITGARLQNVMRHEFGHAIGLGHYNKPGSGHPADCTVMNSTPCGPYAVFQDKLAVWQWQPPNHAMNT
jgi:hypothetical protein